MVSPVGGVQELSGGQVADVLIWSKGSEMRRQKGGRKTERNGSKPREGNGNPIIEYNEEKAE